MPSIISGWDTSRWITGIAEPPWGTLFPVASAFSAYSLILYSLLDSNADVKKKRSANKGISTLHAFLMSFCAAYALFSTKWRTIPANLELESERRDTNFPKLDSDAFLDDSANPIITGRSKFANFLSGWETGYLIYDIVAMVQMQAQNSILKKTARYARESPVFFAHHTSLCAAFLYLQLYIARGREKGIWVIATFFLMYASNPFLHFGWWLRKRGADARTILFSDLAFAMIFAISRFGSVAFVLNAYGQYHSLGILDTFRNLRKQCKIGTGILLGLNGIWWGIFVQKLALRVLRMSKSVPGKQL